MAESLLLVTENRLDICSACYICDSNGTLGQLASLLDLLHCQHPCVMQLPLTPRSSFIHLNLLW